MDFLAYDAANFWKTVDFDDLTAPAGNNAKSAYSIVTNPMKVTAHGLHLGIRFSGTLARSGLLDFAIDPAGDPIISNIALSSGTNNPGREHYFFPLLLPAATRLYARYQMSGSGAVCSLTAMLASPGFYSHPFSVCDTYGVSTSTSLATAVTAGVAPYGKGTWTAIATMPRSYDALSVAISHDAYNIATGQTLVFDVGIGIGSVSAVLWHDVVFGVSGAEDVIAPRFVGPWHTPIPAGYTVWIRSAAETAAASYRFSLHCFR